MAQYQRFLSYLFEYEGDQKKENCGFAKIEIRGDVQRIFLSVKNNEQAEILHVFGFYHTKDGCDCVPLGRMVVKNGKGQLQYINNGVYLAGSEIHCLRRIEQNKQHSLKMNRFWKISLRKNFKRWKFAVRLIAKKQTK